MKLTRVEIGGINKYPLIDSDFVDLLLYNEKNELVVMSRVEIRFLKVFSKVIEKVLEETE